MDCAYSERELLNSVYYECCRGRGGCGSPWPLATNHSKKKKKTVEALLSCASHYCTENIWKSCMLQWLKTTNNSKSLCQPKITFHDFQGILGKHYTGGPSGVRFFEKFTNNAQEKRTGLTSASSTEQLWAQLL